LEGYDRNLSIRLSLFSANIQRGSQIHFRSIRDWENLLCFSHLFEDTVDTSGCTACHCRRHFHWIANLCALLRQ